MSTATATFTPFAVANKDIPDLPDKGCIGYVQLVGEAKITSTGTYIYQPIILGGTQGAPSKTYTSLMYRPEWLRPGFDPETLDKGARFMYMKGIGGARNPDDPKKKTGALSVLAGLAGSWDQFIQLSGQIIAAIEGKADEDVMGIVQTVLTEYVNEENPVVGYVLKQKTEKTEEVNAAGKNVYVKADGYDVNQFFFVDTESQYILKRAAAGKLVACFE